jgi:hypothetical protein
LTGTRSFERYWDDEFINRTISAGIESNYGGQSGIFIGYDLGEKYDSVFRQINLMGGLQLFSKITVIPNAGAVKYGDEKWQWFANSTISWRLYDKLSLRIFVEGNSTSGTQAQNMYSGEPIETMKSNLLVSYEVQPGSTLYLVFNQPRNYLTKEFDNIYMVKFSYSLRF